MADTPVTPFNQNKNRFGFDDVAKEAKRIHLQLKTQNQIAPKIGRKKYKKHTFINNEEEFNNKKKFGVRRMASSASLIEYFADDAHDEAKMLKMNNKYFYHEHTVNFNLNQYLETLIIHMLCFILFGPFINLYTVIFHKSAPWFMNNL